MKGQQIMKQKQSIRDYCSCQWLWSNSNNYSDANKINQLQKPSNQSTSEDSIPICNSPSKNYDRSGNLKQINQISQIQNSDRRKLDRTNSNQNSKSFQLKYNQTQKVDFTDANALDINNMNIEDLNYSQYSEQKQSLNNKNQSFDLSMIKSYISKAFSGRDQQGQDNIQDELSQKDSFFELDQIAINEFADFDDIQIQQDFFQQQNQVQKLMLKSQIQNRERFLKNLDSEKEINIISEIQNEYFKIDSQKNVNQEKSEQIQMVDGQFIKVQVEQVNDINSIYDAQWKNKKEDFSSIYSTHLKKAKDEFLDIKQIEPKLQRVQEGGKHFIRLNSNRKSSIGSFHSNSDNNKQIQEQFTYDKLFQ